jgi:hypothetical protein
MNMGLKCDYPWGRLGCLMICHPNNVISDDLSLEKDRGGGATKRAEPEADLGSITCKCNRLHYNYFAIFMITLHYDYIIFKCNRLHYNYFVNVIDYITDYI